jgi:hypothetical protein
MKTVRWLSMVLLVLLAMPTACTPPKQSLTIARILKDPAAYADKPVTVRGYGVTMMTVPLCPGYSGMDMRTVFVDEQEDSITAVLPGDAWEAMKGDELHDFQGYLRIFNGEAGCPGNVSATTIPYFEITGMEGDE